ncbi:hypothetical protein BaRGS_00002437 [Batillaria attramentaria]|uniref:Uncharacterized protein n=1 Tax=Batillaria attramentaria TaxID=370345 RepID=A0ABD0M4A6_9CAEN
MSDVCLNKMRDDLVNTSVGHSYQPLRHTVQWPYARLAHTSAAGVATCVSLRQESFRGKDISRPAETLQSVVNLRLYTMRWPRVESKRRFAARNLT